MAHQWQETAEKTGAKVISFCGHDSIPWDLSVMKMQEILKAEGNDVLVEVSFWDESKGGAPGGTFATAVAAAEGKSPKAPTADIDPFRRLPDGSKSEYRLKNMNPKLLAKAKSPWDGSTSTRWAMPFVMAEINAAVVSWSHALRSTGSKSLVYRETLVFPDFQSGFVGFVGFAMFGSMLLNPLTLALLKRFAIPGPGEGPSIDFLENKSYLCISGEGVGEKGNRVESTIYFPKDGGYVETARMLVEAGLCLALEDDGEKKLPPTKGGFWTPSTGMGNVLMKRLLDTGTTFEARVVPAVAEQ
jgi:short subunit dehydrogenase-like uncharacterized protein